MDRKTVFLNILFIREAMIFCYLMITDIQPPKFTKCPSVVYGYTAMNSLKGKIVWEYPTASDNHDKNINIIRTGSVSPNETINVGTYTITYNATDSTGNKAIPCVIKVVMKGKVKSIIML